MKISLPYPDPALWPNKRPHWAEKARAAKKLKEYAWAITKGHLNAGTFKVADGRIPIKLTLYPKPTGPAPDADNTVAAVKAALDGIALGLGINDKLFAAPLVEFSPDRLSKLVVEVGL